MYRPAPAEDRSGSRCAKRAREAAGHSLRLRLNESSAVGRFGRRAFGLDRRRCFIVLTCRLIAIGFSRRGGFGPCRRVAWRGAAACARRLAFFAGLDLFGEELFAIVILEHV